jgi:Kef-type K+ transport system membrane component KefB
LGVLGFFLSILTALAATALLGAFGLILSPLLAAIALCATSVGIVVPVLLDTRQLETPAGQFTLAGGSVAEVGTIALLGMFFAGPESSAVVGALLFAAVALFSVGLLVVLRKVWHWERGRRILDRLADTSAQLRVRFAMMVMLGAAILAVAFSFEAILGTFLAGAVVGFVIKGDRFEKQLRVKLESAGFGFFIPTFFIASGMSFNVSGLFTLNELGRIALFLTILLLSRALPVLIYRRHLGTRQALAAGLLQATNLSFIVVAVEVGHELGRLQEMNATALVFAGLLSAVIFPATAQALLGGGSREIEADSVRSGGLFKERL